MATVDGFSAARILAIEDRLLSLTGRVDTEFTGTLESINNLSEYVTGALEAAQSDFEALDQALGAAVVKVDLFEGSLATVRDSADAALIKATQAIKSVVTEYAVNDSETTPPSTGWSTDPPARLPNTYIWSQTLTTYNDDTSSYSDPVLITGNSGPAGANGADGADGAPGAPGTPGSNGIDGTNGVDGADGRSINSITPYFLQVTKGTAAPAKPTTNPPGGSWNLTEPNWTSNTDLYRTELVVFDSGSPAFMYTDVSKVSSYTAAEKGIADASTAANLAQSTVIASQSDPGHQVGRIWLQTDGTNKTTGIKISNGSSWSSYLIVADQIMVPSSVGPTIIADGAISTPKILTDAVNATKLDANAITSKHTITGPIIQTNTGRRGVKIFASTVPSELQPPRPEENANAYGRMLVYDASGNPTLTIDGSTGSIVMKGSLTSGSTITGANFVGGSIFIGNQTNVLSGSVKLEEASGAGQAVFTSKASNGTLYSTYFSQYGDEFRVQSNHKILIYGGLQGGSLLDLLSTNVKITGATVGGSVAISAPNIGLTGRIILTTGGSDYFKIGAANGSEINTLRFGSQPNTTPNASGDITVSHNVGGTSYNVMITSVGNSSNAKIFDVVTKTATSFTVRVRSNTNALVTTATSFDWVIFK